MRASRSSQFLTRSRFLDRFCRSLMSLSAGKMTCLGVCFMNRCKITGKAARATPAASPALMKTEPMGVWLALRSERFFQQPSRGFAS